MRYLLEASLISIAVRKFSTAFGWTVALMSLIAFASIMHQDNGLITGWSINRAIGYNLVMLECATVIAAIVAFAAEARTPGVLKVGFLSTFVWTCWLFSFLWFALIALM